MLHGRACGPVVDGQVRGVPGSTGAEVGDAAAGDVAEDRGSGSAVLAPAPGEAVGHGSVGGVTGAAVVIPEVCGGDGPPILAGTAGPWARSACRRRRLTGSQVLGSMVRRRVSASATIRPDSSVIRTSASVIGHPTATSNASVRTAKRP